MNDRELAIAAIRQDAEKLPDALLIIGRKRFTYREIVTRLGDPEIEALVIAPIAKNLQTYPMFKATLLKRLGL